MTASEDGTARVWDLQVQPLPALQRHSTRVHAIAASTDQLTVTSLGKIAMSGLDDFLVHQSLSLTGRSLSPTAILPALYCLS